MKVVIVVDGPVITTIFKVETSVGRLTISRYNETRLFAFCVGNHGKRQRQRQRYVGDGHIDGPGDYFVIGDDFGFGEFELIVWVLFEVAGGIAA